MAQEDGLGRDIKLLNGNVASRILPIRIHDLDTEDVKMMEDEMKAVLRTIDFIYKSPGVNRPLRAYEEEPKENLNHTLYRNQINKVANAVKEIVAGMVSIKNSTGQAVEKSASRVSERLQIETTKTKEVSRLLISTFKILRPGAETDFLAFSLAVTAGQSLQGQGRVDFCGQFGPMFQMTFYVVCLCQIIEVLARTEGGGKRGILLWVPGKRVVVGNSIITEHVGEGRRAGNFFVGKGTRKKGRQVGGVKPGAIQAEHVEMSASIRLRDEGSPLDFVCADVAVPMVVVIQINIFESRGSIGSDHVGDPMHSVVGETVQIILKERAQFSHIDDVRQATGGIIAKRTSASVRVGDLTDEIGAVVVGCNIRESVGMAVAIHDKFETNNGVVRIGV